MVDCSAIKMSENTDKCWLIVTKTHADCLFCQNKSPTPEIFDLLSEKEEAGPRESFIVWIYTLLKQFIIRI